MTGLGLAAAGVGAVVVVTLAVVVWRDLRPPRVSGTWLDGRAAEETKAGWDGPRWRFPAEWRAQAREERFRRMAEARSQQRKGRCA